MSAAQPRMPVVHVSTLRGYGLPHGDTYLLSGPARRPHRALTLAPWRL